MKATERKLEEPYTGTHMQQANINIKTIKLVEGINNQISKFLNEGYDKNELKSKKLYKQIPETLKSDFERLLEEIVGNTKANGDKLNNSILYFGKSDKSKNREGSAEHILTDHFDQINNNFIINLSKAIKYNKFEKVSVDKETERYQSIYEFKNDAGKSRYFIIVADKDENGNLRIVTAFIKSKIKKK